MDDLINVGVTEVGVADVDVTGVSITNDSFHLDVETLITHVVSQGTDSTEILVNDSTILDHIIVETPEIAEFPNDDENNINIVTITDNEVWPCPYRPCTEKLSSCDDMTRHILTFHITRVFKCNYCERLFHTELERDYHETYHTSHINLTSEIYHKNLSVIKSLASNMSVKLYKCSVCDKVFVRKHHLTRHTYVHTRPFKCKICSSSYVSKKALDAHKLSHDIDNGSHTKTGEQSTPRYFRCIYCPMKYSVKGSLRTHVFKRHFDGEHSCLYYTCPSTNRSLYLTKYDADRYRCDACGIMFARRSFLLKHQKSSKTCETVLNEATFPKPNLFSYRCSICSKRFHYHFQLTRHILRHIRPYSCNVCAKSFVSKAACKAHTLIHSGLKPMSCDQCDKRFRSESQLTEHKLSHNSSNPFKCFHCDKHYSTRGPLRGHVYYKHFDGHTPILYYRCPVTKRENYLSADDANKHVCDACHQSFSRRNELLSHYRVKHSSNPRPFICDKCGAGFPNKTRLNIHTKSHTNSRDYQCSVCGVKCTTRSSLTSHMVIHNSRKPFSCDVCSKSFARTQQLKRHHMIHTGERKHQCDVCGKMFATMTDVKKHSVIHQACRLRPHHCVICDRFFTKQNYLTAHMKTHLQVK